MKEKILKLQENIHFKLLGISSKLSIHKLSWALNENLNFEFQRLESENENSGKEFEIFHHETPQAVFSLIENKSNSGLLIKKLPNIDYFLKIEGNIFEENLNLLIKKIRQTSNIYACLIIDISLLKKKDIELLS